MKLGTRTYKSSFRVYELDAPISDDEKIFVLYKNSSALEAVLPGSAARDATINIVPKSVKTKFTARYITRLVPEFFMNTQKKQIIVQTVT